MFHASLLKRAAADPFLNQRQDNLRPPAIIVDGEKKMGNRAYSKETHQRPPAPGFSKMERVFKTYVGTHGGSG